MDQQSYSRWLRDAELNGWVMGSAPLWKRLPVVRHIRWLILSILVARHNDQCRALGWFPTGEDEWRLWGVRNGFEQEAE
jgi:hypothetical protein